MLTFGAARGAEAEIFLSIEATGATTRETEIEFIFYRYGARLRFISGETTIARQRERKGGERKSGELERIDERESEQKSCASPKKRTKN